MTFVIVGLVAGWFAVSPPEEAQADGQESTLEQIEKAEELSTAGWELWKQRKYSEAAKRFEQSVKLDPEGVNAWNGLGWSQFNGGESLQAVVAFERCVKLAPKHGAALNGLGQTHFLWKEYDKAEKYLLEAEKLGASAAWLSLAKLYLLKGEFEKAKPWASKIAEQTPQNESAQQMLAAAKAGKLDDALRRLLEPPGKPIEQSPDVKRGWAMFNQGKNRTAERLFRRALKADPENLAAINGLGFSLLNQGKHEEAKPLFERYLKREKDAPGPLNGLARCLEAEGKSAEAQQVRERMAE